MNNLLLSGADGNDILVGVTLPTHSGYYVAGVLVNREGVSTSVDYSASGNTVTFSLNLFSPSGTATYQPGVTKYSGYAIILYKTGSPAPEPTVINTIKIKNATITANPGEKPKFTAESAEPDLYYVYVQEWDEVEGGNYLNSNDFWNRDADKLISTFVEGKHYKYGIWIKPKETEDHQPLCTFAETLTVELNGTSYNLDASQIGDKDDAGIWVYPLTVESVKNTTSEQGKTTAQTKDKTPKTGGDTMPYVMFVMIVSTAGLAIWNNKMKLYR